MPQLLCKLPNLTVHPKNRGVHVNIEVLSPDLMQELLSGRYRAWDGYLRKSFC
jgi:hypothetical protein